MADAEAALAESQALYHRLEVLPSGYAADPRLPLGIIALIRGDYSGAARLGEEARRLSEAQRSLWSLQIAYYTLARVALLQGQYEAAQQYAQQAYTTTQTTKDRWFRAYCLTECSTVTSGDILEKNDQKVSTF